MVSASSSRDLPEKKAVMLLFRCIFDSLLCKDVHDAVASALRQTKQFLENLKSIVRKRTLEGEDADHYANAAGKEPIVSHSSMLLVESDEEVMKHRATSFCLPNTNGSGLKCGTCL